MIVSTPSWKDDVAQTNVPLVDPDDGKDFAVRYIWMKHKNNEDFLQGYFTNGNSAGLNVRKQTVEFQEHWNQHNKIFIDSANNGDLIWRVKVLNDSNRSVDYIEVWKDQKTIVSLLEENPNWSSQSMSILKKGIYDAGFIAQKWLPYPTVSKEWSVTQYKKFAEMSSRKLNCIINTPMKL